jgi:hypothetical protein
VNLVQIINYPLYCHAVNIADLIGNGGVESDGSTTYVDDTDDAVGVEHLAVDCKHITAVGVAGEHQWLGGGNFIDTGM